jgi:prepilin-type processing-associated H-X9-DG protein/prepilin-type N-terminal cleavage/methylation domain-containing protein
MKRRGFTWIELVVVLGLVLLLATILFPIFARSRDGHSGRTPAGMCQQTIRQMGLAIRQYLADYDEAFPIVTVGIEPFGWADACQPYVKNTQVLQCPSDTSQPPSPPATNMNGSDPKYTDYFYNSRLAGRYESDLAYIANTIMLGDAATGDARQHSDGGTSKQPGTASLVNRSGVPVGAAQRHLDGANYGFADGHVKWLQGSDSATCLPVKNAASGAHSNAFGFAIK